MGKIIRNIFTKKKQKKVERLLVSYSTNIGMHREENQDNYFIDSTGRKMKENISGVRQLDLSERRVFSVFDGMGGEACGAEASELASAVLIDCLREVKEALPEMLSDVVNDYISRANNEICDMTSGKGCGTSGSTFAMVCIDEKYFRGYSLGDSKILMYDKKSLCQINEDQTVAAQKVRAGIYSWEEAVNKEDYSKLTMFIGVDFVKKGLMSRNYGPFDIMGKTIVLCSDGLTNACDTEEIIEILSSTVQNKAEALVNLALCNDADDNVTCIVIDCIC